MQPLICRASRTGTPCFGASITFAKAATLSSRSCCRMRIRLGGRCLGGIRRLAVGPSEAVPDQRTHQGNPAPPLRGYREARTVERRSVRLLVAPHQREKPANLSRGEQRNHHRAVRRSLRPAPMIRVCRAKLGGAKNRVPLPGLARFLPARASV